MFLILFLPLLGAVASWCRHQRDCRTCKLVMQQLSLLKHQQRTGTSTRGIALLPALNEVVNEAVGAGLKASAALSQATVWIRLHLHQGQKANRLRLIWCFRLAAVIFLAGLARASVLGSLRTTLFGSDLQDSLLLCAGFIVLGMGSFVFLRGIPQLEDSQDDATFGIANWLRHRLWVDNGLYGVSIPEISDAEREEFRSGISLQEDKISALDAIWQTRISSAEARREAIIEILPLIEFVCFGVFLIMALAGTLTRSGFFH